MSADAYLAPDRGPAALLGAARLLARGALQRGRPAPRVGVALTVLTPRGRSAVELAMPVPTNSTKA